MVQDVDEYLTAFWWFINYFHSRFNLKLESNLHIFPSIHNHSLSTLYCHTLATTHSTCSQIHNPQRHRNNYPNKFHNSFQSTRSIIKAPCCCHCCSSLLSPNCSRQTNRLHRFIVLFRYSSVGVKSYNRWIANQLVADRTWRFVYNNSLVRTRPIFHSARTSLAFYPGNFLNFDRARCYSRVYTVCSMPAESATELDRLHVPTRILYLEIKSLEYTWGQEQSLDWWCN